MALDISQVKAIIDKISYKNWTFKVQEKGSGFLFQASFYGPDAKTGEMSLQKCRKWYVSPHACEGEIVRTVYKGIEAAEIHELQERFKYCGQTIFSPHLHPEDLAILLAGEWIGYSVRAPMNAPNEFRQAARKALMITAKEVAKKGSRPKKPRTGVENVNGRHGTR